MIGVPVRKDGKLVKLKQNKSGYNHVSIKGKSKLVHRLVLMAFDRMPEEGELCRHLNDDKTNNNLENLKWGTPQENTDDAIRNGIVLGRPLRGETPLTKSVTVRLNTSRGLMY